MKNIPTHNNWIVFTIATSIKIYYNLSIALKYRGEYMLDFFMDASNIPADYAIYVSFILGLMIKFLWVWNIQYSFHESLNDTKSLDSITIIPPKHLKNNLQWNPLLHWITKCIRKKDGLSDDPDSDCSFLLN